MSASRRSPRSISRVSARKLSLISSVVFALLICSAVGAGASSTSRKAEFPRAALATRRILASVSRSRAGVSGVWAVGNPSRRFPCPPPPRLGCRSSRGFCSASPSPGTTLPGYCPQILESIYRFRNGRIQLPLGSGISPTSGIRTINLPVSRRRSSLLPRGLPESLKPAQGPAHSWIYRVLAQSDQVVGYPVRLCCVLSPHPLTPVYGQRLKSWECSPPTTLSDPPQPTASYGPHPPAE